VTSEGKINCVFADADFVIVNVVQSIPEKSANTNGML